MSTNNLVGRVTGKPSFAQSFNELRAAQKTKKGVPLYSLYINRPAGRFVAAALRNSALTPNHVTLAGAVLTYGALLWLAFGAGTDPGSALIGVILAVGFILDSADGQLARLQGRSSRLGEWLDHVLDSGRIVILHGSVFCFLTRTTTLPTLPLAVLCGVFLFASSIIFFAGALFDQLSRHSAPPLTADKRGTGGSLRRSALMLPVDYGVTCLMLVTVPWVGIFLSIYAAVAFSHCLFGVAYVAKCSRALARMG